MPVPTAVPPSGTASSSAWAARARRMRLLDLAGVAAELLAEADRRRVLEVGPAGLDDRPERLLPCATSAVCRRSRAGSSASSMAIAAESWSAVGIVSFELWQRLTSSFGMDRPAATEPGAREVGDDLVHVGVRRGARSRSGRCRSGTGRRGRPSATSAAAAAIALGDVGRRAGPSCAVGLGRGELDQRERAGGTRGGSGWPEIGKLRTARWVEAP